MIGKRGAVRTVRLVRHGAGSASEEKDAVVVEEPMEIRVSWTAPDGADRSEPFAVTMRTPGHDFELAAGFLHGEGVVSAPEEVVELTYCTGGEQQEYNVVEVRLRPGVAFDPDALRRNVYTSSSCGVCGKASLDAVSEAGCEALPENGFRVSAGMLPLLPDRLLEGQSAFARTGGLHAAGLFDADGEPVVLREDVGRHNALDKLIGNRLLERSLPAQDRILVVSGRASFELVQKALAARIPVLVAVGAPSSLAVDLARRFGQTLVGFVRDGGFNVYTGEGRLG